MQSLSFLARGHGVKAAGPGWASEGPAHGGVIAAGRPENKEGPGSKVGPGNKVSPRIRWGPGARLGPGIRSGPQTRRLLIPHNFADTIKTKTIY